MTEIETIELIKRDLELHSKDLSSKYKNGLRMAINALAKIDSIKKIIDCTIVCNDANKVKYDAIRNIVKE